MQNLRLSLVQGNTRWHDPAGNRDYYAHLLKPLAGKTDVVILPETFSSGFSNDAIDQAETMHGPTVHWLIQQSQILNTAITGSVQLRDDNGKIYNRLLWVTPDQVVQHYDKRHLFRYAGEHKRYAAGQQRLCVEWKGWRINPQICYDLRFPVFCRNQYNNERPEALDFDLQIFVANWPSVRAHAWKTLLRARAIENLCYVAAVNRVGVDGNNHHYSGDSAVIDFQGNAQLEIHNCEQVVTTLIDAQALLEYRQHFPAMLDADTFHIENIILNDK